MDAALMPATQLVDSLPRVASSDACGSFCTDGSVGELDSVSAGRHLESGASGDLSPASAPADSAVHSQGKGNLVTALQELLEKTPALDWADDEEDNWFIDSEEALAEADHSAATTPQTTPTTTTTTCRVQGFPSKCGSGPHAYWTPKGKGNSHCNPQGKGKGKGGKGVYGLVPSPVKYPTAPPHRENPKPAQWSPATTPKTERALWQEIGSLRGCSDPSPKATAGAHASYSTPEKLRGTAKSGSSQDWRCSPEDSQPADRFGNWQPAAPANTNPFGFKPRHQAAFAKKMNAW
eukprot:GGOE01006288.1.p1 GENE.GGOE01006288.1~~GGOE01006288.1.p1  ORF type:complete len:299 (+),score=48.15 GGOE01006288.1:23-898(+)